MSLSEAELRKVKKQYDDLKAAIVSVAPFITSLLKRVKIILDPKCPTVGIDDNSVMYVNPEFWASLSDQEKAWIIGHEIFHIAWGDHARVGTRNPQAWNVVTDAVNNEALQGMIRMPQKLDQFGVTISKIWYECESHFTKMNLTIEDLRRMNKEELYRIIPWQYSKMTCAGDLQHEGDGSGQELQPGSGEYYDADNEDRDQMMKDAVAEAYANQKMIGKDPAGLQRLINGLLQPKVNWQTLLRTFMQLGLGKTIVGTWKRPSRKRIGKRDRPGIRRFTIPEVYALIDTSGSVSRDELKQFLSEVYHIAKTTPVHVICWDGKDYPPIVAKTQSEVISKVINGLKGGGGTVIGPALKSTLKYMKNNDLVVVLTDGDIFDLDQPEVMTSFRKVGEKSSVSIFCTTRTIHHFPKWESLKVDV